MITGTTDNRTAQIEFRDRRELQKTVIGSRLKMKDILNRKCVYLLNDLFDKRKDQQCAQIDQEV
jgi:hypothetical protein